MSYCQRVENIHIQIKELESAIKIPWFNKKTYYGKKFRVNESHDWHMLMQQLMPLRLRGLMQPHVQLALMWLNKNFHVICAKVWDPREFQALRDDVATTLSLLECTIRNFGFCNYHL